MAVCVSSLTLKHQPLEGHHDPLRSSASSCLSSVELVSGLQGHSRMFGVLSFSEKCSFFLASVAVSCYHTNDSCMLGVVNFGFVLLCACVCVCVFFFFWRGGGGGGGRKASARAQLCRLNPCL